MDTAEPRASGIDWRSWLRRWDAQQTGYIPHREERIAAMLDVLEELLPEEFVALDLACGPGSLSWRLLSRFPKARCVALDFDPVLLAIGRGALGEAGGRLRWIEADLLAEDWVSRIGESGFDAVLSTTALHWLPPDRLVGVYAELGRLLPLGGLVLNGDRMPFGAHSPALRKIADATRARDTAGAFEQPRAEDWRAWWKAIAAEPALRELLAERERRFPVPADDATAPTADLHQAALLNAGFREVGVVWQRGDDRVLVAVR